MEVDLFDKPILPKNGQLMIIHSATRWCGKVKIVIAVKRFESGQSKFVTWAYVNGDYVKGHVFSCFNAATEDFNKRVQG